MKILLIDDNKTLTENISIYLKNKGYSCDIAYDGAMAFDMIKMTTYDFLIVDRMMPKIDGLSLIRMLKVRSIHIPFLFLTALSKQIDKIEGLEMGADDYLVKPFDLQELVLRIENIIRRGTAQSGIGYKNPKMIAIGLLSINLEASLVTLDGVRIDLSPKEYGLLEILIKNQGKVLDRTFLYETVWGDYDPTEVMLDTVNVHIAHLRKKLGGDSIRTVKLLGYIIDNN